MSDERTFVDGVPIVALVLHDRNTAVGLWLRMQVRPGEYPGVYEFVVDGAIQATRGES